MALSSSTAWDCRTTGSDATNGGGFRYGALIAAPAAPAVAGSGSGGTVAAGTYYIVTTYTDALGETVISPQTAVTVSGATASFTTTSPAASTGAISWSHYCGTTSGGPYFPQGTGLTIGSNRVVTTTPPTTGTQPRGVDYSQQDAPQINVADGVSNGTTMVTSATAGFTGAHVGNVMKFAGAYYDIVSVTNSTTVVVDRTIAALSGQALSVGGSFASPGQIMSQAQAGNVGYVKAGTYTLGGGTVNTAGQRINSSIGSFRLSGYQATHDDLGTRPVFQAGAGSITLVQFGGTGMLVENIEFQAGGQASIIGLTLAQTGATARSCKSSTNNGAFLIAADAAMCYECEASSPTGVGFSNSGGNGCRYVRCTSHGCSSFGFSGTGRGNVFEECISYGNGATGFNGLGSETLFERCVSHGNTGANVHGWDVSTNTNVTLDRCIAVNNGTSGTCYGFAATASNPAALGPVLTNCAGFGNLTASTNGVYARNLNFQALSASPFVAASTNFGLNSTAGAGALVRGMQTAFPGLAATITYLDAGAAQHQDAGGGGGGPVVGCGFIRGLGAVA